MALFACLVLLASSLCAQTPQKSRIVTVDHGAQDPAISPDGARIAISVLGKIFVLPRAGGEAQQVSTGISWDTNPAWSPDGQFLAFAQDMPGASYLVLHNMKTGNNQVLYHSDNLIQHIALLRAALSFLCCAAINMMPTSGASPAMARMHTP